MYTIHIDGNLLFSSRIEDDKHIILSPTLSLDVSGSGSLSFVMPPGHALYDSIHKMKSIITVHHDDELLFRGRILEDERDFYNQKNVYCEGDLSFLLDSLHEEQTFKGKAQEFFRMLIENHNKQVDDEKKFTVGTITAADEDMPDEGNLRVETRRYWDTSSVINDRLLGVYGGYLRTRTEGGITYIDWLKEFEEESKQPIQFSVNMLDLKDKVDAGDVFTCLIPLGYSEIQDDGTYADPVNIKSVNGGVEYIADQDAVNRYGKIWRTKTWGNTKQPDKLLEKAQEYLKAGAELRTLTLTAVDMRFTDGNAEMIRIGTKVHIVSDPHGIDLQKVCCKMDIDLIDPEKTTYTFGERPRTLSEAVIRTEKETNNLSGKSGKGGGGGGRKSVQEEMSEILRWARIQVDEANASISLNAGEINKLTGRMNSAEIAIDGANANITLNATAINDVTGRVSSAEVKIDGLNSEISAQADKITLNAKNIILNAEEIAKVNKMFTGELTAAKMVVTNLTALSFKFNGNQCAWKESPQFIKSFSLTAKDFTTFVDGEGYTRAIPNSWTINPSKDKINYIGWA